MFELTYQNPYTTHSLIITDSNSVLFHLQTLPLFGSSSLRANIILFKLSLLGFDQSKPSVSKYRISLNVFRTHLINNVSFSSSTNVISHHPPTLEAQRPYWYSFLYPIDVGSHSPPLFVATQYPSV